MFVPEILLNRRFCLRDTALELTSEAWRANPSYDASVYDAWARLLQEAAHANLKIWDGTYYRALNARSLDNRDGTLSLRLGTIPYRYMATYRVLQAQHESHGLEPFHHISTAAIIYTSDGWCIFGKRARNGSIDLIGGGLQADELEVRGGIDLERNLRKEMREEIGLSCIDHHRITGLGVLLSGTSNVIILSGVNLNTRRLEAEAAFHNREEDEMAEEVFVRAEELNAFLASLTDYRALIPSLLRG